MPLLGWGRAVAGAATACGLWAGAALAADMPSNGIYQDRIDWGVIMDLSGPTAASQALWVSGLRDRLQQVNEAGGVNGRRINLLVEDDRFDPALQRITLDKLAN